MVSIPVTENIARQETVKVLQQYWQQDTVDSVTGSAGHWYDVPTENET